MTVVRLTPARARERRFAAEVCVIGAGLAGLAAAEALSDLGVEVEILEAQATVGGRIKDAAAGSGAPVELGANWFSRRQPLIAGMAQRLGVATIPTYDEGDHLLDWGGRSRAFRGAVPPLGLFALADIGRALARFDSLAARFRVDDPWGDPAFARLDARSFGQWIDANLFTTQGRRFFRLACEMVFGVEPGLVSLLYTLTYAGRSDSLTSLMSVTGGHQELRFRDGPGSLCAALAERIGAHRIRLSTPVRAIDPVGGGVEVEGEGGVRRYAAALIAVSPHAARAIAIPPRSVPESGRFLQAQPMGRVIKVQAVFDRPHWRELGLSGQAMSDGYPLTYTIDNSPGDASVGVLAGFVCSSRAERFLAEPDPKACAARAIDALFGGRVPAPHTVLIEDWAANRWVGGSYGAYCPPGVMTALGRAVRDDIAPIHWCGAERGRTHPCQMEGAIESALRAAVAVRDALPATVRTARRGDLP